MSNHFKILGLGPQSSRIDVFHRFQIVQEAYHHLMDEFDRADQESLPSSSSGGKRKREEDDQGSQEEEAGEKRKMGAGEGEQGRSQRGGGACGSGTGDGDNKVNPDISDSLNRFEFIWEDRSGPKIVGI